MADLMTGKKYQIMWDMMWKKYQKEKKEGGLRLGVRKQYQEDTAVYDCIRNRTASNINTHRVIFLNQKENGIITAKELSNRLEGSKKIRVTGTLKTSDGEPGISAAKLTHGKLEYEVVFTDLPFYTGTEEILFETGGIVTGDIVVRDHRILKNNLLCTKSIRIEAGAVLEVLDGMTLVYSEALVSGTLKGFLTGNLYVSDGGEVNGMMFAGDVMISGKTTLVGMYYGDLIKVEDYSTLRMKEFGSLTNAMELGKGAALEFEDGEPLVMAVDTSAWSINGGHTGGDAGFVGTNSTGSNWYLSCARTPADILGRTWSVEMTGNGVLMPSMGGIGLVKTEPDVCMKVVENTEHNYAMFMLNNRPFTNIEGAIHIHAVEGVACPPEDIEAIEVTTITGSGTGEEPYCLEYKLKDHEYVFRSAEDIGVQAATKKAVMERFKDVEQFGWQYAVTDGNYTWYGYEAGTVQEHWDGPTGDEKYIVKVIRKGEKQV